MISLLIFVVALTAAALPASAQTAAPAQGAPVIQTAELRLWPEYDDPGVLVIVSGQFAEGTKFPLQASFPVPAGARNIQATYLDASGSPINKPFEIKDGALNYELPSAGFHYEYYVDRAPSGDERDIAYDFVAPYAIGALKVAVQQPARATGFALSPAADNTEPGQVGLTDHLLNRRNLAAGEKLALDIKYSKADTGLSAPQLAVAAGSTSAQPAAGTGATTAPATTAGSTNWLPLLLIGLGVVLLAAVVVYWVLAQRRSAPAPAAASAKAQPAAVRSQVVRSTPPVKTAPRAEPAAEAVSFCTNCGHGLKPEDRFCAQCGAPRRS